MSFLKAMGTGAAFAAGLAVVESAGTQVWTRLPESSYKIAVIPAINTVVGLALGACKSDFLKKSAVVFHANTFLHVIGFAAAKLGVGGADVNFN